MYRYFTITLLALSSTKAEEVEVYRPVEISVSDESKGSPVTQYGSPKGKPIFKIDTGKMTLGAIVKTYRKGSWSSEPFYGPAKEYIFKDVAGKLYIAHFEYEKGHRTFERGIRCAIIELSKVKGLKDRYVGSPYNGSSVFDPDIMKQLKDFAKTDTKSKK